MKGGWVPKHVQANLEPMEVETLHKLLTEVKADEQFPLNEMEEQVVDSFLELLEEEDGAVSH